MRVLATAGHVDHGKSTLVLALTGTDPDRLAEEKARGLTIDLGFAVCSLPSGGEVAFVDVPGHVRFIKNMLAGVGAVDACLFVVAATEGWKPQSEEHLRILSLLGLSHGVIALTKSSLVDDEWAELVEMEVRERVDATFLADAEVVAVDALSGAGLGALRAALARLVAATPPALDRGRARLWVDRAFPVRGAGTVVTGTLTGGSLAVDDTVAVEPGGLTARVRRLHSHHVALERAAPGRRLAVNLAGLGHADLARGQAVVHPGQWHRATVFDASLSVLATLDHEVGRRGAYAAYVGSGEFPVKVRVLGRAGTIAPGESGAVRLWLPANVGLPVLPGDRYVLREAGRSETVGGGEVLDVSPVLAASRAAPDRSVERVVTERGWVDATEMGRLVGIDMAPTLGRWVVDPTVLASVRQELCVAVSAAGRAGIDLAALDDRRRAVVAAGLPDVRVEDGRALAGGGVATAGGVVAGGAAGRGVRAGAAAGGAAAGGIRAGAAAGGAGACGAAAGGAGAAAGGAGAAVGGAGAAAGGAGAAAGGAAAGGRALLSPEATAALAVLERDPWSPPQIDRSERSALRELAKRGLAVEAGDVWFATSAVSAAAGAVAQMLAARPDGVTVAEVRDALGTSRKHVLPLMGYFDTTGVTRRRGDVRVAGPRLPQATT